MVSMNLLVRLLCIFMQLMYYKECWFSVDDTSQNCAIGDDGLQVLYNVDKTYFYVIFSKFLTFKIKSFFCKIAKRHFSWSYIQW